MQPIRAKIRPSDIPDVEVTNQVESGSIHAPALHAEYQLLAINSHVCDCIPKLTPDSITHFFTCGHWSSHELLYHILLMTGPAEVLISVWSISETAARLLLEMLDKGLITKLSAVLDYRSKNRHPAAYHLAKHSFSQVNTMVCHAKLTVITNSNWNVTINGSANYTNNPRPEAGYIDTSNSTAAFYSKYINQMLNNSNPFE